MVDRLYRGFVIEPEAGHYRVTNLDDPTDTWTVDTVQEGKADIDERLDGEA